MIGRKVHYSSNYTFTAHSISNALNKEAQKL